jgi:hypothetical protein
VDNMKSLQRSMINCYCYTKKKKKNHHQEIKMLKMLKTSTSVFPQHIGFKSEDIFMGHLVVRITTRSWSERCGVYVESV